LKQARIKQCQLTSELLTCSVDAAEVWTVCDAVVIA